MRRRLLILAPLLAAAGPPQCEHVEPRPRVQAVCSVPGAVWSFEGYVPLEAESDSPDDIVHVAQERAVTCTLFVQKEGGP